VAALAGCQGDSRPVAVGEAPGPKSEITNGQDAGSCQWPATAALVNYEPRPYCSATLIHPRFVLTAAHCIEIGGMPLVIAFGEDGFEPERQIEVVDCELHPEYKSGVDVDLALCELSEAVDDVAPIPVLMGCEQEVLTPDAQVTIVGFGNTQSQFVDGVYVDGQGIGPKRYVAQAIHDVRTENEEIDLIGIDTMSGGCHGDSGGGAFVQLADGTWRVFGVAQSLWNVPGYNWGSSSGEPETTGVGGGGFIDPTTTSGGSTSSSFIDPSSGVAFIDPTMGGEPMDVCGYGTTYSLVTPRMDWVEAQIGEDVTPCFTTDGTWDPNEACTPFPMQIDQSVGTWATGCASKLGGEPQCGELPAGTSTGSSSSTTSAEESSSGSESSTSSSGSSSSTTDTGPQVSATSPSSSSTGGGGETSDTEDPGAVDEPDGCGCRHDATPSRAGWAALVLLLGVRRRRRRNA
jgi:MYXO-CTERM domain-containing protein